MRILRRCVLGLAAVWSVALLAIFAIEQLRPTPRKFLAYVAEHPLHGLDPARRASIIERTAELLNGLSFEQRQELRETRALRTFFTQLTSDERRRFIDLTVPQGFHQMIAALNKMEPAQRRRLVQRTMHKLRTHHAEADILSADEDIQRLIFQGFSTFNQEAGPEVRADFAPLIEELQRRQATRSGASASSL